MGELFLSHITKAYSKKITAINDLSLHIADGEFIVLLGPSGCGKSTLLRIIAGLIRQTSGELIIDNKKMNGVAPKNRDVSMVFQEYSLYPHMTAYQNMAFGLKERKLSRDEIEARVQKAADMLEITPFLNQRPSVLSGGQKQRVAIGRAITRQPKILLMDEPFSNLDEHLRQVLSHETIALHKSLKNTCIYVTHNIKEAINLNCKIVLMKDGKIQQYGTFDELLQKPVNLFVANFFHSDKMNFFSGTLCSNNNETALFISDNFQYKLSKSFVSHIKHEYLNSSRPVVIGIHSGGFLISESPNDSVKAEVRHTDRLGDETVLYVISSLSENTVKITLNGDYNLTAGAAINFIISEKSMVVFDSQTTASIMQTD